MTIDIEVTHATSVADDLAAIAARWDDVGEMSGGTDIPTGASVVRSDASWLPTVPCLLARPRRSLASRTTWTGWSGARRRETAGDVGR